MESKTPPFPCLSDMQRRLNSLMNSQVTRGLDYYSPTPPYTHDHTHIKHTFTRAHIKTRRPTQPWWSTRQSNVPGICSCLVWRVFPTLPPSPGSRQHQLPQWWESRPLWRAEEGWVGEGGSKQLLRGKREWGRERAWMIMWKYTVLFINAQALQLHMLAPDTHPHVPFLSASGCYQALHHDKGRSRHMCVYVCVYVCGRVYEVKGMGIVSIWSFDNYYSLCSDQILKKCDIFHQQCCQTYLAFLCVSSKVLHGCATLQQQQRCFACIIRVVINDIISD